MSNEIKEFVIKRRNKIIKIHHLKISHHKGALSTDFFEQQSNEKSSRHASDIAKMRKLFSISKLYNFRFSSQFHRSHERFFTGFIWQ
ncbi:CLUMA_CG017197, isoform A [Clunio marinus]|uniref:CLUMA_CG017197, isoform A n=1 Tax=Clunio marinus TaxID=568069 RepID=A0A1J1IV05_9DIPT|nr:CLUMA_CG017197, isoform A [Clunio marinus]